MGSIPQKTKQIKEKCHIVCDFNQQLPFKKHILKKTYKLLIQIFINQVIPVYINESFASLHSLKNPTKLETAQSNQSE